VTAVVAIRGAALAAVIAVGAGIGAGAGCGDNDDGGAVIDKPGACGLGESTAALAVVDRKIVGAAAGYHPDLALRDRTDELRRSTAARRAAAWQVVSRVLTPVPLAEPRLAAAFGGQPTVPAWHTWYARDDLARVFQKLYRDLGTDGRRQRAAFGDAAIAAGLDWNTRAADDLGSWPEERYLAYLAAIDRPTEVGGVAGIGHVGYSPGATRHLLAGYARTHACRTGSEPAPWSDEPVRPLRPVTLRETVAADSCGWVELGPYLVAAGSQLTVSTAGSGDADVYVRRGQRPDATTWDCRSSGDRADERCTVDGGGPVFVAVFAATDSQVTVDVAYTEADTRDPACVDGELPADAVLIKAEWRRAQFGATLPTYDTTGARMAARLRADGQAEWGPGDGQADPGADDIYTVTTPDGASYRLAGLHILSKELEHWMWVTMWWSPDADSDFGADRPAVIAGPWRNYKMCAATDYADGDPDARGGAAGSLGDALAAVRRGTDGPSWCSNPYIEQGPGNAATNCIGCHQHGGTALVAEDVLDDPDRFPHRGTTRVRNNFPADYLWAVLGGRGDDLAAIFQTEIDNWDATDRAAP
jgi:hypothetical protein